jgi:hypothetical protein
MALIEAGAAALEALKTASDLIREVRNSDSVAKLKAVIDELASRLLDARSDVMEMQEEIQKLKRQVVAAEAQSQKKSSFESTAEKFERSPFMGGFVYKEKEGGNNSPNYCANCFANEKLSILQSTIIPGHYKCPACSTGLGGF